MDNISDQIRSLCLKRDAVILAHYYVDDAVQDIADYIGDSFYLAKVARSCRNKVLVFCGVTFMGESACILNPDKTVLLPDDRAVCPMALMADAEKIQLMRQRYPNLAVVCYINSTAEIKALSDICVTSSNAVKIVNSLDNKNVFFIPDGNLGRYVASQVTDKNIILNNGFCHVHTSITAKAAASAIKAHPQAKLLVHPECTSDVCAMADYVGSTKEIIEFAVSCKSKEFIIGTEAGVIHAMKKAAPGKSFYCISESGNQLCPSMRLITLEKIRDCLLNMQPVVNLDRSLSASAAIPLSRMLETASK